MDFDKIQQAAQFIDKNINIKPQVGIVCGSGINSIVENIQNPVIIPYSQIPNFPVSTVKGHKSQMVCGRLGNKDVLALLGRFHYYEGYTMEQVTFPIRVMQLLGIKNVIITNAAGGLNASYKVGDIMMIKDHINLAVNPLIGQNDDRLGVRFPSLHNIYSPQLREKFAAIAKKHAIDIRDGVYLGLTGPSFETGAENRFFRMVGADCVGMSTVAEVIVAAHAQMNVFAASIISNVWNEKDEKTATHEEVLQGVEHTAERFSLLIEELIADI
ncbi:MAG: purine-nucleoside phosphorylase [Bacteroidales bacterium]|jgi:purine-nucleoside phosphorylase|nr:purine-nucleoside phosphorylase [Bacteroidales bacterium]